MNRIRFQAEIIVGMQLPSPSSIYLPNLSTSKYLLSIYYVLSQALNSTVNGMQWWARHNFSFKDLTSLMARILLRGTSTIQVSGSGR